MVDLILEWEDDKTKFSGVTTAPRSEMSRASLLEAYIAALPDTVVSVVASEDGRRSRIETCTGAGPQATHVRLRFKSTHADLVLSAVAIDGWASMAPAELLDLVVSTAERLGARWQTEPETRAAAEAAVVEIVEKIEAERRRGGLAQINAQYRRYRLGQVTKGEKAMPYSAYVHRLTVSMVRQVAEIAG